MTLPPLDLGAIPKNGGGVAFTVWAPLAKRLDVSFPDSARTLPLAGPNDRGYFFGHSPEARPGDRYWFQIDGKTDRPDPASRSQPEGVHAPSRVESDSFSWNDDGWAGRPLADYIFYELHIGTFTPDGTFDAALSRLPALAELGVTAVEIMPVAQFPGNRNWGYDGVYPFAVQNSYGGADGLKRFVDACHKNGLAAVLDVVYNHLGPEGNYLSEFGPYFTERYRSPWGSAINMDGPRSDEVRRFFIENARRWIREFHFDALRVDAIHGIPDFSAVPFLEELCAAVHDEGLARGRPAYLIAESDLNDPRVIRSREMGGFGFDAQWCDDFHHALHVLLTGERDGYYEDFSSIEDLKKAVAEGFVYAGQYSAHRRRRHGSSAAIMSAKQFAVFSQNHDQIGNRMLGERLTSLTDDAGARLAAAAVILSPFLPILFMGEEYAEEAPFQYFISHEDAALVEAVRKGRAHEFKAFGWKEDPPDPFAEETFRRSMLRWELRNQEPKSAMLQFYRELLTARRDIAALRHLSKEHSEVEGEGSFVWWRRWFGRSDALAVFHFGSEPKTAAVLPPGRWTCALDSSDRRFGGPGRRQPEVVVSEGGAPVTMDPRSAALFTRTKEI